MTQALRRRSTVRRWFAWLSVALVVLPMLALTPYLSSGTELVRLRNAVLLQGTLGPEFDWAAPPPANFPFDAPPLDPFFVDIARKLQLQGLQTDWDRALAISRHLLGSHVPLSGGGVQTDLRTTYAAIVERGEGYCADFVRAFMAIASAAGMPARAWSFSFDGFGGHGHVFPEIWDRQAARWRLVDVFSNYSFAVDGRGPLSAAEFRDVLSRRPDRLQMNLLTPQARSGWTVRAKAIDYYRRGLDEWYLMWGGNVLAVEKAPAFSALRPLSYTLAQVGAVLQGVHPGIRLLPTPSNVAHVATLRRLRAQLGITVASMAAGVAGLSWLALTRQPRSGRGPGKLEVQRGV